MLYAYAFRNVTVYERTNRSQRIELVKHLTQFVIIVKDMGRKVSSFVFSSRREAMSFVSAFFGIA